MAVKTFGQLKCEPLTVNIGAFVSGVNLNDKLSQEQLENINQALLEYEVIFFRDQDISSERHQELAHYFGEPHVHPAYNHVDGFPDLCILESTPENPTKIELWHTDMTFHERPPLGSFLRSWKVPEVGGDTMWGSTTAAYNALDDEMKKKLSKLTAVHSFEYGFKESIAEKGREAFAEAIANNPPVTHPVIRTHPVKGTKNIFVNRLFTTHIEGMDKKESDELLEFLYQHMIKDEFTCRFRWQDNSMAIWDNRCTIHKPVNDYFPNYRQLRRITIHGDKPFYKE
jgi:taurine dioxygenase